MKKALFFSCTVALFALILSLSACLTFPSETQESETASLTSTSSDTESDIPADSEQVSGWESEFENDTESETSPLSYHPDKDPYVGTYPNDLGFSVDRVLISPEFPSTLGKTSEELIALFDAGTIDSRSALENVFPVAGGCIINLSDSYFEKDYRFYDLSSGEISKICPDTDCDPAICPLARAEDLLYADGSYLYFTAPDPTMYNNHYAYIYRCDLARKNIEELMRTDVVMDYDEDEIETNEAGEVINIGSSSGYSYGFERILLTEGDLLYMTKLHYAEGEIPAEEHRAFGVFDCRTKTFTPFEASKGLLVCAVIDKDTVWCYNDDAYDEGTFHYFKTDIHFSEVEPVPELDALLEGPYTHVTNFTSDYLLIETYDMSDHRYTEHLLYNPNTGKIIDYAAHLSNFRDVIFAGNYVYYTKDLTDEQIAASPLQEYFEYTFTGQYNGRPQKFGCLNMEAGRIFRMNLDTMEEELVLTFSFNGVPVWIRNIRMNGGLCYITYSTYRDFRNLYNKRHVADTEPSQERFAVLDLGSGTVRLVHP